MKGGGPPRALGLLERHAGEVEPELVGVIDPAVRAGGPDDSGDEVGQGAVLLFAGAQGFAGFFEDANRRLGLGARLLLSTQQAIALLFGLLAFGNIDVRAGHPVGLAGGVPQGHAAGQDPAIGAVFVAGTVLVFVKRSEAIGVGLVGGQHALALFGMKASLPFFNAIGNFMVLIAEDAFPARRKVNIAGAQVPVP